MSFDVNGLKCLVLGGSGFIGSNLCRALIYEGATVRSLAQSVPSINGDDQSWQHRAEWFYGDFSNSTLLRDALRGVDVVFHLISTTIPASSNADVCYDLTSNVLPTLKMLELAKEFGVRKIIFISSGGAIYGKPERVPIPECHGTNPICAYGIHKLAIERYLHLYHHLSNLEYAIVRPSNPYGVGQPANRPQGVIANFIDKALSGQPVEIWGDGRVVRDYIYVEDLIRACLLLVRHKGPSRIFNIGTGQGHTLLELRAMIESITGEPIKVHFREARSADVPVNVLDISRAASELNWHPTTDLATGLGRVIKGIQNVVRGGSGEIPPALKAVITE
jgi:UDP-glucose 4-epimerase